MYCTNCGKQSQKNNKFCTHCGKQIHFSKKRHFPKLFFLSIIFLIGFIAIGSLLVNHALRSVTIPMQNRAIGANVDITGSNVSPSIKATEVKDVPIPLKNAVVLGPAVDITPDGPLTEPVTLRFKLNTRVDKKDFIVIASKETGESEWTYEVPNISADGQYAMLEISHNTIRWPLKSLTDFAKEFKQEFKNSVTGGYTETAEKPVCNDEEKAREDGYQIESSSNDSMYWCFGMKDGKRILRVTNRKRYPLDIKHPRLSVIHPGDSLLELRQIVRWVSGEYTILFPHDEATYEVKLENGQNAYIQSDFSWNSKAAVYLDAIERSLMTVNTIAMRSGMAKELKKSDKYKMMNAILDRKECTNTFGKRDWMNFMKNCMSSEMMSKAFGRDKDKLLIFKITDFIISPFSTAGNMADWFAGLFSGYIDEQKRTSYYYVLITRDSKEEHTATPSAKPTVSSSGNSGGMPCPEPTPGGTFTQTQGYWMLCGASLFDMQ